MKMNHDDMMGSKWTMFIGMFLIQYVFMSFIMSNHIDNITNSVGKIYMSTMMGLFMIVFGIVLETSINWNQLFLFIGLLLMVIFLYKIQLGVNDKNYLLEMIEHHSMALLTSKQILQKTNNSAVADIAQRIVHTQEREIQDMRNIIGMIHK